MKDPDETTSEEKISSWRYSGLAGTFVCRVIAAFSSLLFAVVIARSLGSADTGAIFFSLAILIGLSFLALLGQHLSLANLAAQAMHDSDRPRVNSTILLCASISLCISALLILVANTLLPQAQDTNVVTLRVLWALPAVTICYLFAGCFKGMAWSGTAALLEQGGIFAFSLFGFGITFFFGHTLTLESVLNIFLSSAYFTALLAVCVWFYRVPLASLRVTAGMEALPSFIGRSINMGVVALTIYLMQWGNVLVLGVLVTKEEVGLYAAAERLATAQYFIFSVVVVAFANRQSTLHYQRDTEGFRITTNRTAFLSTIGALPIALVLIVKPEWAFSLFGEEFYGGENTLRLLSLAYLVMTLVGNSGYSLMVSGHERQLRNITLLGAASLVAMDLLLIPFFGATGAAMAVLFAYLLQYVLYNRAMKRFLGFYVLPRW
jgi:O-antigen/teichoic acid export membrane protein